MTLYDVNDFPYEKVFDGRTVESGNKKYCEYFATFDIETTSVLKRDYPLLKKSFGFMYVWQMCVDGVCLAGRTWEEYQNFVMRAESYIPYGTSLVVYVHNLSFEFQFMNTFFKFDRIFARKKRKIIEANSGKFEYRCSYFLSNMSLAQFTQKTPGVTVHKMDGEDFDYTVLRYPDTELTNDEWGYCICDVLGLWQALCKYLEEDTLITIPMTSTGFVRRDFKEVCINSKEHMKRFISTKLNKTTYVLCKETSRGAISGSNFIHTNELLEFLQSFDIKSSYPYQMMTKYFPSSKFTRFTPKYNSSTFNFLLDNRCCLIEWSCKNLRLKHWNGIPYISKAKCRAIEGHTTANGKVFKADRIGMCCTEIDFRIIESYYDFDEVVIHQIHAAERGMLSKPFRKHLASMFQKKCDLDGVDKFLYDKYKNKINSGYGMMLTDILNDEILFDSRRNEDVWYVDKIEDVDKALNNYYSKYGSFLSYQDGVWVLAHARDDLNKGMLIMGNDLVQVDTDSCKGLCDLHDYRPEFQKLNEEIIAKAESYDVKPYAFDKDGNKVYLGIWEFEGEEDKGYSYRYFKTLGAKKYCYDEGDGELHITVAGLSKGAAGYIKNHGSFDSFTPGFVVPPGVSGRTSSVYNDEYYEHERFWEGHNIRFGSNVAVENIEYTFGVTGEWMDMILDGKIDKNECMAVNGAWWSEIDSEDMYVEGENMDVSISSDVDIEIL